MLSNDVIVCGFASSSSWKSAAVRPRTGLPSLSVTVTGTSITRTSTEICAASGSAAAMSSAARRSVFNREPPWASVAHEQRNAGVARVRRPFLVNDDVERGVAWTDAGGVELKHELGDEV